MNAAEVRFRSLGLAVELFARRGGGPNCSLASVIDAARCFEEYVNEQPVAEPSPPSGTAEALAYSIQKGNVP